MCNEESVQTCQISLGVHPPCIAETSNYAHTSQPNACTGKQYAHMLFPTKIHRNMKEQGNDGLVLRFSTG